MAANPVSKKVFGHTWVSIHVRLLTIKHKLVPWSLGNISRHRIWLEQFTVNNSGCKSTFHRVFSIIFHTFFFFFLANCLSDAIRSTLFLPHHMVDKELVPGLGEVSPVIFHVNLWFKLRFLIVLL